MIDILIVGDGLAGLVASVRCVERGVVPTVVSWSRGASAMTSGAADFWLESKANVKPGDVAWLKAALERVGAFELAQERVATSAGTVREVEGVGRGILALGSRAGQRIGVVSREKDGFSSQQLAKALGSEGWSRETETSFLPLPAIDFFSSEELAVPLASFVRILEEDERRERFGRQLKVSSEKSGVRTVLTGPWLGRTANEGFISDVGEVLSPPDGSFGARYEFVRDRYFKTTGIRRLRARVERVSMLESGHRVFATGPDDVQLSWDCKGLLVCTGELLGGGQIVKPDPGEGLRWTRPLAFDDGFESGDVEGWDPLKTMTRWLRPQTGRAMTPGGLQIAGDARLSGGADASTRSVLGAALSARNAVDRLLI